MKNLKYAIIIICTLIVTNIFSQTISPSVIDAGVKKMSNNIAQVLTKTKSDTIRIIVLPIYDYNGELKTQSEEIGKAIAHQLNADLKSKGWNFVVWYYTDFNNKDLTNLVSNTDLAERDANYYQKLIDNFNPDYIVTGNYSIDNKLQKFHIQNVNIYQNWTSGKNNILSAANVEVDIEMPNSTDYLWRSAIVPGWGQIYKEQKSKGIFLLSGFGVLATGTIVS